MSASRRAGITSRFGSVAGRDRLAILASRLARGDDPADLVASGGATAEDLVAAIALAGLDGDGPALVHSPRPGTSPAAIDPSAISRLFPVAKPEARIALRAGLLQILDLWGPSHEAAQEADDLGERMYSPYWHAIAHRREPDLGNAGYWFRRVGRHPVFADVAAAAGAILDDHGDARLKAQLLPGGSWEPMAFVAFCGVAARQSGSNEERAARRIQRAEMIALLDATIPSSNV